MAKVSSATIRLVQKLNRKNKNGEYPLYIVVCFNGRLEKATKISCLPKFWDSKREIVRRNVENEDNIPLIDLDCRYYSYRHSYIMKEIQKPTVNLLALAQTVGKSATTLHQYISLLGEVDLV